MPGSSASTALVTMCAGGALSTMRGYPTQPNDEGHAQSLWSAVGLAELSPAWHITSWLRLRCALTAGTAAPRPTVRFDGAPVASWGRPFAAGTLGFELQTFKAAAAAP